MRRFVRVLSHQSSLSRDALHAASVSALLMHALRVIKPLPAITPPPPTYAAPSQGAAPNNAPNIPPGSSRNNAPNNAPNNAVPTRLEAAPVLQLTTVPRRLVVLLTLAAASTVVKAPTPSATFDNLSALRRASPIVRLLVPKISSASPQY